MPGSVLDLGKSVVDSLYKNSSPFQIYILFGEEHHQQQKKVNKIYSLFNYDKSFENKKQRRKLSSGVQFKTGSGKALRGWPLTKEKDKHNIRTTGGEESILDGGMEPVTEKLIRPCAILCTLVFFHKYLRKYWNITL